MIRKKDHAQEINLVKETERKKNLRNQNDLVQVPLDLDLIHQRGFNLKIFFIS